ncbi:MAG: hypothetical protein JNK58_03700 [Phycisphaerae bacterium]|nr:hypothetical protein [Phycisphaerae bacterium]
MQPDNWYAYFKKCVQPPPWPPPSFQCVYNACEFDDVVRVRVTCFTIASGSFFSAGDCVFVGEIDEEDLECLSYITPMTIASPYELGLCREAPVFIAGWGKTVDEDCKEVQARSLHVAATTISAINCGMAGRKGAIMLAPGSCVAYESCLPEYRKHDSGGAIAVEMQDGSLRLVGVIAGGTGGELLAVRHQFFEDPSGTEYLCQPCRPVPCVDLAGPPEGGGHGSLTPPDGRMDETDYSVLTANPPILSQQPVNCWCMLDVDQDGCAPDAQDVQFVFNAQLLGGVNCDRFQWCYGDATLDGRVNQADEDFVEARLNTECPCASCPVITHWCPGDLNCDGFVDSSDLAIITAVRALEQDGDVECQDVELGCSSQDGCP